MKKNELIEQLENEIESIKGGLNDISIDFYNEKKHYLDSSSYICDYISEFADNNIDIYTSDLFDWAKYNDEYIEQAICEFGIDKDNFSLTRLIQSGQYLQLTQDLYNNIDEIIKMFAFYEMIEQLKDFENYEIDEIEIEIDFDEFVENVESLDHNNYFDDIVELVEKTLNNNDDEE